MLYRKHKRVHPTTGEHSMTKQSHLAECDIYNILGQYQRTGIINHINRVRPTWEDLPSDYDFQSALNTINQANDAFAQLPAAVRDSFGNDPENFLAAFQDDKQRDRLQGLGLLKATPAPENKPAPPAPPAAAP